MTIKITYKGKPDNALDDQIKKDLGNNFKWYAQGYDFEKDERDICFDVEKIMS